MDFRKKREHGKLKDRIARQGRWEMAGRYFIERVGLTYILAAFPTASVLVLLHRKVDGIGRYYWIAYWIINALAFFEAWRLINVDWVFF